MRNYKERLTSRYSRPLDILSNCSACLFGVDCVAETPADVYNKAAASTRLLLGESHSERVNTILRLHRPTLFDGRLLIIKTLLSSKSPQSYLRPEAATGSAPCGQTQECLWVQRFWSASLTHLFWQWDDASVLDCFLTSKNSSHI